MPDPLAKVAVIGRIELMPGILPVKLGDPAIEYLVAHSFPSIIEDPRRNIKIDTSDCTFFTVTHRTGDAIDLSVPDNLQQVFYQSLAAISEVSIWLKSNERQGVISPFIRQIGTTDVKAFFVQQNPDQLFGWQNPLFMHDRATAGLIAGLLGNTIIANGPQASPVPPITRRVMASLDLISLGFYTESFINLFSLVDDLTQEVIKAGMIQRGLHDDEQKVLLRAIKEERLKVFLCQLAKLCGWKNLEEADPILFADMQKVNATRNKTMHGSRRLSRAETIESQNILMRLIDWLRSNPFAFSIPIFPQMMVAHSHISIIPLVEAQAAVGPNPNTCGEPPREG